MVPRSGTDRNLLLSGRGGRQSADGHILGGRLVEAVGDDAFRNAFDDPSVALVHVRAVECGCFLYEVRRPSA